MMMKKIIGSIITLFHISCLPDATLSLLDLDGHGIKEASIGVPFILKLNIDRYANDTQEPVIKGLKSDKIKVDYQGTSSTIQNINGHVTVDRTFTYKLRIDEEGEFVLGPATLRIQGGNVESNQVTVKVVKSQVSNQQNKKGKEYSLELSSDQYEFYVGQKIIFKLVAKLKEGQQLLDISELEPKNFTIYRLSKPEEARDGDYFVFTWTYDIFPEKSGTLVIPSVTGTVNIPNKNAFFSFFNSYNSFKAVSNSLSFKISPLPGDQKIDGIGKFTKFLAQIDKKEIDAGDGIVLKLILQGDGNFAKIQINSIAGLPSCLRSFKSNVSLKTIDKEEQKIFEFVLQGLKEGTYEIPAQKFSYFDPDTKKYKNLETKSISIKINKGKSSSIPEHLVIEEDIQADSAALVSIDIKSKKIDFKFPNWLFILLFILPPIFVAIRYLFMRIYSNVIYRYYFVLFKLKLNAKDLNIKLLQQQLIDFVALKFNKKIREIDYDFMKELFVDNKKWHVFIDDLYKLNFHKDDMQAKKEIFENSFYWLKNIKNL